MCSTPKHLPNTCQIFASTCHEGCTRNMRHQLRIRPLLFAALVLVATSAHARDRLPPGFVYLHDVDPSILQDIRYATDDNFTGRPLPGYGAGECVLRREAAEALRAAQAELAREKLGLKVYDCYRPTRAVRAMEAWAHGGDDSEATRRFYPALHKRNLFALGYIASQSRHSTGTTVDLTLVRLPTAPVPRFDPAARYGACTGPASKTRARQQHRHGHRLRLFRRQKLWPEQCDRPRAEQMARRFEFGHAPARLCRLLSRMVALFLQRLFRAARL